MEVPQLEKSLKRARKYAKAPKKKATSSLKLFPNAPQKGHIFDPRGFEYFNQLPQEIKLSIFDYIPFYDWISQLSPVCADWRKLVTRSNRQKILSTKDIDIPHAAMFELPEVLATSKQLTWVSILGDLGDNVKPTDASIPNTVSSVSFYSWEEYAYFKNHFLNIKELRVCQVGVNQRLENFKLHPHLKILHTVVDGYDSAVDLVTRIQSVAPNLEVLHLQWDGYFPGLKRKKDIISLESENHLEKLAAGMGLKLYCLNLFALIRTPDLFIESFTKQGLPYSYYSREDYNNSLLAEACHNLSLPVVKFLLENGHTTLEREYEQQKLPNPFNRVPYDITVPRKKQVKDPYLFSRHWAYNDQSMAMIDYLLQKGFDVHKVINRSLFDIMPENFVQYILENTQVDLKHRINVNDDTVLHVLLPEKYLGLRSVTDKLSKEEIVDIFSVKNRVGDTPLHTADSFPEDLVQHLLELDIGALWTIPNANSQTPLSLILLEGKASPAIFNSLVSLLFTNAAQGPELQTIQLLAERGADFNESVDDCPAIIRLRMISAPILRELAKCGVEFNVANSDNNTILFRALESKHPVDSCEVLEMLVKEFNLNVNHVNSSGITPLICALQYRRPKAEVAKLLEWGADVNHCSEKAGAFMSVQNYRGVHKLEIIELLLKAGADPNMKFYNKKRTQVVLPIVTLLNSTYEVRELMELFVQYGANLNMRDDTGNTLLHLLENDTQIDYLLKFIDVHETNIFGQTALWNMKLSLPAVQIILKVDPNLVNHVANDGSTVLHLHQENPTQLLLLKLDNIDLSVVNKLGQSFMHTRGNGPQVFQPLADAYARQSEESKLRIRRAFNHVDAFGRTVLHYVCEHDLSFAQKMIETFELDVNPNSQSLNLQIGWSSDVIKYLLSKGSNPNAQSVAGYTFLHFICGNPAKAKLIRTMLKYGASIDIKNSSGISPADLDPNLKTGYQFATWSSSHQKEKLFTAKKKKPEYDSDSDSDSDDFRLLKKLKG